MKEILCWTLASLYNIARVNRPTPAEVATYNISGWDTGDEHWYRDHQKSWQRWANATWSPDLGSHAYDTFTACTQGEIPTGEIPNSTDTLSFALWTALTGDFASTGDFLRHILGSEYCSSVYPPAPTPTPTQTPTPQPPTPTPTPTPEPLHGRAFGFQAPFSSMAVPLAGATRRTRKAGEDASEWTFPLTENGTQYWDAVVIVGAQTQGAFAVTEKNTHSTAKAILLGGVQLPDNYTAYDVPEIGGTVYVPSWAAESRFELAGEVSADGAALSSFVTGAEQGQGTQYTEGTWLVAQKKDAHIAKNSTAQIQLTATLTAGNALYAAAAMHMMHVNDDDNATWGEFGSSSTAYFYSNTVDHDNWRAGSWFGFVSAIGQDDASTPTTVRLVIDAATYDEADPEKPAVFGSYTVVPTFNQQTPVMVLSYQEDGDDAVIGTEVPPAFPLARRPPGTKATPMILSRKGGDMHTRAVGRNTDGVSELAEEASMMQLGDYVDGAVLAWGTPTATTTHLVVIDLFSLSLRSYNRYNSIGVASNLPLKGSYRVYEYDDDGLYIAVPTWIVDSGFALTVEIKAVESYYYIQSVELKAIQEDAPDYRRGEWLVVDTESGNGQAAAGFDTYTVALQAPVYMHNAELYATFSTTLMEYDEYSQTWTTGSFTDRTTRGEPQQVSVTEAGFSPIAEDTLLFVQSNFTAFGTGGSSRLLRFDFSLQITPLVELPVSLKPVSEYYDFYPNLTDILNSNDYTAPDGFSAGGLGVKANMSLTETPKMIWTWKPYLLAIPLVEKQKVPEPPRGQTLKVAQIIDLPTATYDSYDDLNNIAPVLLAEDVKHVVLKNNDNNDVYVDSGLFFWDTPVSLTQGATMLGSQNCTVEPGTTRSMMRGGGNYPLKGEYTTWKCTIQGSWSVMYAAIPSWAEDWYCDLNEDLTTLEPTTFYGISKDTRDPPLADPGMYYTKGLWMTTMDSISVESETPPATWYPPAYINGSLQGNLVAIEGSDYSSIPSNGTPTYTGSAELSDEGNIKFSHIFSSEASTQLIFSVIATKVTDWKFAPGLKDSLDKAQWLYKGNRKLASPSGWRSLMYSSYATPAQCILAFGNTAVALPLVPESTTHRPQRLYFHGGSFTRGTRREESLRPRWRRVRA